jgi:hypothetical protein
VSTHAQVTIEDAISADQYNTLMGDAMRRDFIKPAHWRCQPGFLSSPLTSNPMMRIIGLCVEFS